MFLDDVKTALGVAGDDYDSLISDLIDAGKADLNLTDINFEDVTDPLFKRAVITYCRINFSIFGLPDGYEQLKRSYDEQKAQMLMATGYGLK